MRSLGNCEAQGFVPRSHDYPSAEFRQGWQDFALENGFKEGDRLLLFSLVGLSKVVVQVFTEATRLQ